ncbi:hypothetical protein NUM_53150 [Actinocatenispora comari]|uniref:Uncharacterized protein n=1 Tax=Actinocatenispora comari TaxID=2807577 RepID=A0A8J4AEW3_9ACTN|nr:hypothetical protein NUM_53150 [Actinocatenispora comari]
MATETGWPSGRTVVITAGFGFSSISRTRSGSGPVGIPLILSRAATRAGRSLDAMGAGSAPWLHRCPVCQVG